MAPFTRSLLLAALALAAGGPLHAQSAVLDSSSWWLETYGVVDAGDPLAQRAEDVFRKVAAAADRRSNRPPKLVLIRRPERPQAIALPDGSIVLTHAALELCYHGGADAAGDSKLAFVLGHELSHLASDDFWHRAAFAAVSGHTPSPTDTNLRAILGDEKDHEAHELRADAHGIIYATMAGFDPLALLSAEPFIAAWVAQLSASGYTVPGQLDPAERVDVLRAQLRQVGDELDVFHFGARLLQLGRNEDALILLERFRARYPGREVLNDIGVAHLQICLAFLASCAPEQYARFRLPLEIDPGTLARAAKLVGPIPRVRSAGPAQLSCTDSRRFQTPWSEAVRSLRLAKERDPGYAPALQNLVTALLFGGHGTEALNQSNDALLLEPGNRETLLLRAVALYVMGRENDLDTGDAAIDSLRRLESEHPGYPDAPYNLARLLTERGRPAAAGAVWRRFLALVPQGRHADEARRWAPGLVAAEPSPEAPPVTGGRLPSSPLPLGSSAEAVASADFERRPIREGRFRGSILRAGQLRALAIDDVIELVEVNTSDRRSPAEAYGPPQRIQRARGGDLYFYPGLLVEWTAGSARKELFFLEGAGPSAAR